jgi:ribosomal protein S12 methylthiotransferase accessory factor YcaO
MAIEHDDIRAELRGRVAAAPRVRFAPTGESVWEFSVRLAAHWTATPEVVVVRVPDEHYADLQRWATPGKRLYLRGSLRLVRWQDPDQTPRARLLLQAIELMPLDDRAHGSEPAALDYTERKMPQRMAIPPRTTGVASTQAERAARVRALLEETPMP